MDFNEALDTELEAIKIHLQQKNFRYGNSALQPLRIFSKSPADEQINVRIDDKLSRIRNQSQDDTEDSEGDLLGYLVLKRIQRRMKWVDGAKE